MKRVLVVVDYQRDFVTGTLGFPKAETLHDGICNKINECARSGYSIIFTSDTHSENYLTTQEGNRLPVEHCVYDTAGWALHGDVLTLSEKYTKVGVATNVMKDTFGSAALLAILQDDNDVDEIEQIELCGIVTNMCVLSNAVVCKTALPEARIVIHANLCASFDDVLHEKALDVMESLQMDVINREK